MRKKIVNLEIVKDKQKQIITIYLPNRISLNILKNQIQKSKNENLSEIVNKIKKKYKIKEIKIENWKIEI